MSVVGTESYLDPVSDRILIETAEPSASAARRRSRRWRGPSLLVALATLIIGWSLASLGTGGDPEPDPTLVPEPFSPPEGAWTEIEFSGEGTFAAVLDSGEGLIAAGSGRRVDATPFVWTTTDGAAWEPASGAWQPGDVIVALAKGPNGFLAAGYQIAQTFTGGLTDAVPRVWESDDGDSWEPIETSGLPAESVITGLGASTDAVIAIGWEGPAVLEPLAAPVPEAHPRVWSTEDGVTWTDITPDGAPIWFADIAATPTGVVIGGADDRGPAVWRYEQGVWSHLPAQEPGSSAVTALAWSEDGLIALTRRVSDPEALVFVWSVTDQGVWSPALTGDDRPGMAGWVSTVDGTLFAASAFTRSVISSGPEVFASRSGREWVGVEVTAGLTPWPPPRITSVVDFRGELYAFGSRASNPAAWRLDEGVTDSG